MKKIISDAAFTGDRLHRIWLKRIWDESKPKVMIIGLNPSTANATSDDATIRRVVTLADTWGYGGVYMMNLFTFISTDPKKLDKVNGNIPIADEWLKSIAEMCKDVVFAWGNFKVMGRDIEVKAMFPNAKALHINKNGSPKHPLYCAGSTRLINYLTP